MDRARRTLVARLAGLLAAASSGLPGESLPAPPPKQVVICLGPRNAPGQTDPARETWADLLGAEGFADGRDIEISVVRPRGPPWENFDEWDDLARAVVGARPSVIVVGGLVWLRLFQRRTSEIPIVAYLVDLESFAVHTLRRPGRNVTGVADPFFDLQVKRIELMKELRPGAKRFGLLQGDPVLIKNLEGEARASHRRHDELMRKTARRLGMDFVVITLPPDVSAEVMARKLRDARVQFVDLMGVPFFPAGMWERLEEAGIAASLPRSRGVHNPALLGYSSVGVHEMIAGLIARIIRGEDVATIPATQPREYHLSINLRTARVLGITVPPSILLRAQEVIQ